MPSICIVSERVTGRISAGSVADEAAKPVTLRPQQRGDDRAEQNELGEAFGEIGQRLLGEQPAEARHRRNFRQIRHQRLDREHDAMLHHVAGERREA